MKVKGSFGTTQFTWDDQKEKGAIFSEQGDLVHVAILNKRVWVDNLIRPKK
jgi:hypothetical protein